METATNDKDQLIENQQKEIQSLRLELQQLKHGKAAPVAKPRPVVKGCVFRKTKC